MGISDGSSAVTVSGIAYAFFIVVGLWLSVIDVRQHRLPNRIVLPSIAVGAALLVLAALVDGQHRAGGAPGELVLRTLAGGALLFGVYLVLALVSPRSLGMGDVKFAALIGLYLAFDGWRTLLFGAAAGFAGAAIVGAVLLATRRVGRRAQLPFGPLMFLGAVLAIAL